MQLHNGLWLRTLHVALIPHTFREHGLMHLLFIQALSAGHSELTMHSGRQPVISVGMPNILGRHLQIAVSCTVSHIVFGPHGEGWHGFGFVGSKYTKHILILINNVHLRS